MAENRDFIMARLGAARALASAAGEALDSCIILFISPEDDKKGTERNDCLEIVSDIAGDLSRSIEMAQACMAEIDPAELKEEEPDLDAGGEEDKEKE